MILCVWVVRVIWVELRICDVPGVLQMALGVLDVIALDTNMLGLHAEGIGWLTRNRAAIQTSPS